MTALTISPTLREIFLDHALVATARQQRDPSEAHEALRLRWTSALRQAGGAQSVPHEDFDVAMTSATATVELDKQGGCFCGQCGQRAAA